MSEDMKLSLIHILAPVMTVNDDVYGKVSVEEVEGILAKYRD